MTAEDRMRRFILLLESIHRSIGPVKQETFLLEEAIGYDNLELIDASDMVIRQQESLQSEYAEKILYAASDEETEVLLKEFEEGFYNTVLDYRNVLQQLAKHNGGV